MPPLRCFFIQHLHGSIIEHHDLLHGSVIFYQHFHKVIIFNDFFKNQQMVAGLLYHQTGGRGGGAVEGGGGGHVLEVFLAGLLGTVSCSMLILLTERFSLMRFL